MFYDDPEIMYENPRVPKGYEFDFDTDPVFFTYHRPQKLTGFTYIQVDRSLIHKNLLGIEEKQEVQNSPQPIREDESTKGNESNGSKESVESGELIDEVSVTLNTLDDKIDKNKSQREKVVENDGLKETKVKSKVSKDEAVAVKKNEINQKDQSKDEKNSLTDSDISKISKTKTTQFTKTSALESISKSYSSRKYVSNSDSDREKQTNSKSSSHKEKSRSKKSSGHRKKDSSNNTPSSDTVPYDKLGSRSTEFSVKEEIVSSDEEGYSASFTKKSGISVKAEASSDKNDKRDKTKSSTSYRKRRGSDNKDRLDGDNSRNRYRGDPRKKRYDSSSSDDSRKRYSDDDNSSNYSDDSRSSNRNYVKREIKQEPANAPSLSLHDHYCSVCKLVLNTETIYSSHMAGKKHKKALRQLYEQEVAKSSIKEITKSQGYPLPPDMDRIPLYGEKSKIQDACDDVHKFPVVGLDYVDEIRGYAETKYFCNICDAQCGAGSILWHLGGFKHRLYSFKKYFPRSWMRHVDKNDGDRRVIKELEKLADVVEEEGSGTIQVFKDVRRVPIPIPYDPYQPSTSRQYIDLDAPIKKADELAGVTTVTDEDCLSRDFSDFYCKVCDSHMNNRSIWESHARGKRHAKNKRKAPDGLVTNSSYIEAPHGTISRLEKIIHQECHPEDIIVGLSFIKENQGENGDMYNCFLCGSICPTMDILDHLYFQKHKQKYLEKMLANGHENAIRNINELPLSENAKEALIDEECINFLSKYGRGKPVIAIAKRTF